MQAVNSKIEEEKAASEEKQQTIESLNELLAQANQDLRHEREARRAEMEKVGPGEWLGSNPCKHCEACIY